MTRQFFILTGDSTQNFTPASTISVYQPIVSLFWRQWQWHHTGWIKTTKRKAPIHRSSKSISTDELWETPTVRTWARSFRTSPEKFFFHSGHPHNSHPENKNVRWAQGCCFPKAGECQNIFTKLAWKCGQKKDFPGLCSGFQKRNGRISFTFYVYEKSLSCKWYVIYT